MKKPKKSIYTLRVRGLFLYKIKADTEKEARQILEEKSGRGSKTRIEGKLIKESYATAQLLSREDNKEKNK